MKMCLGQNIMKLVDTTGIFKLVECTMKCDIVTELRTTD